MALVNRSSVLTLPQRSNGNRPPIETVIHLVEGAREVIDRASRNNPPPSPSPSPDYPTSWNKFNSNYHTEFAAKLREFRGDNNLEPPSGYRGSEGQIFLSERNPSFALKRWFNSTLDKMNGSVKALQGARAIVDTNPALQANLDVVQVYERGSDWILRDFDANSTLLSSERGNVNAFQARTRAMEELYKELDNTIQTRSATYTCTEADVG